MFDHFLIPTLNATLAFPEMSDVALAISNDLDLDMAVARDGCLFSKDLARRTFLYCPSQGAVEARGLSDKPDTPTSTAIYSLDHDGIPGLGRKLLNDIDVVGR